MDPFSIFTGKPMKQAQQQTRQYLEGVGQRGRTDLEGGYGTAIGAIGAGTRGAEGYLRGGYGESSNAINNGYNEALSGLYGGKEAALGQYQNAANAFNPLSELAAKYGKGSSLYIDSLGANGAEAAAKARQAFTAGPAYNFNLDQGLEAINRARNARGMANSGNTDRESQDYGAGLASREFGGWQDRLAGLINPELAATSGAASGRANAYTNAGNLEAETGRNVAGLATGRGGMLSELASRYGQNMAGLQTGQGSQIAQYATGLGQNKVNLATQLAQPYAQTYGKEAEAQMAGAGNLWNLGMQGAKLAAGGWGGLSGMFGGSQAGPKSTFGINPFEKSFSY